MSLSAADLVTRGAVEDTVVRMFVATDERDWQTLERCLSDPFTLDMTSVLGGAPVDMTPHEVAEAWAASFGALDHVHHQIGNLRTEIDGARAVVRCYGVAFHHREAAAGGKTRTFVGTYEITLREVAGAWRIERLVFALKFIDGNLALETA